MARDAVFVDSAGGIAQVGHDTPESMLTEVTVGGAVAYPTSRSVPRAS